MASDITSQSDLMRASREPVVSSQIINPLSGAAWDENLTRFESAGFFHSSAWARVLNETYGLQPVYFKRVMPNDRNSVVPTMEARSWFFRRRGISLPFTDECPALVEGSSAPDALFEEIIRTATARSWTSWEYRGGRAAAFKAPASQSFFGHRMMLKTNTEELFAGIDGSARTSVRKALQQGVSVGFSTDMAAVRIFHGQLCATRQRHGLPPQPFRFFEAIHRHVLSAGLGTVAIARQRDQPVASAVFFHFNKSAIYKFAASDFSFRQLQANHLVLWSAIEHYAKQGFQRLDFGRTSRGNQGLRHFKLAWRPEEYDIHYAKYDCRHACFLKHEKERTTGWHNRVFRALPQPISRLIGAVAYRHMA